VLPHHAQGRELNGILPTALTEEAEDVAKQLRRLILDSKKLLKDHEVNLTRELSGKKPANMVWPWGPGKKLSFPSFKETHGISGSIIAAVDLIKGIAGLMSMKILDVPGATGYSNTNYENKASYALRELEETDLVFIHVEAPDEASHNGDFELKIHAIEDFDRRLLGRILEGLKDECIISVLPDHYTSLGSKRHTWDPVPFLIFSSGWKADYVSSFDEVSAIQGSLSLLRGDRLIPLMLRIGEALKRQ
jgi:2,3-bisphosphoglycerate-independent phosphoglycerate mutase